MSDNPALRIDICSLPKPHFVVRDWAVADEFEDYLTESCDFEYYLRTEEDSQQFIRFIIPAKARSVENLRGLLSAYLRLEKE